MRDGDFMRRPRAPTVAPARDRRVVRAGPAVARWKRNCPSWAATPVAELRTETYFSFFPDADCFGAKAKASGPITTTSVTSFGVEFATPVPIHGPEPPACGKPPTMWASLPTAEATR
jgi:hypothetical protein